MKWDPEAFKDFFQLLNDGHAPYEWQCRLAEQVATAGRWPSVIAAPTGAGKSSVVDIHVWALASSDASVMRPPRRLCVVVNRRALVDSHIERAEMIAARLREPDHPILERVASRLVELTGGATDADGTILKVVTMRGGLPRDRAWVDHPQMPMIVGATPDMWGSRLLFRGYGSARHARPREAGMLAYDSVLVLDEAHLSRQLLQTARDASDQIEESATLGVQPLQVVAMTATPDLDLAPEQVVRVGVDNLPQSDAWLRQVLTASKTLRLVMTKDVPKSGGATARYADLLAAEAVTAAEQVEAVENTAATVLCVVNNVETALALATRLRKQAGEKAVVCWVGRSREADLTRLRQERPNLFGFRGDDSVRFLVATQTVEVGVDIDCSALVTELAPGSALTQRFGRVNRRGLRPDSMVCVVVPTAEIRADRPPYSAEELREAMTWLSTLGDGADVSPDALDHFPAPGASLDRLALSHLDPSIAELLSHTSTPLCAEPSLEFWLRESLEPEPAAVGLVLRGGRFDTRADGAPHRMLPADSNEALALLRMTPPAEREVFPVTISTAREVLTRVFESTESPRAFLWRDDDWAQLNADPVFTASAAPITLRPGDHVVLDGCHAVTVEGVVVTFKPSRPEEPELFWGPEGYRVIQPGGSDDHWLRTLAGMDPEDAQARFSESDARNEWQICLPPEAFLEGRQTLPWIVVRPTRTVAMDGETHQEWTPSGGKVLLDVHQAAVSDRASLLASALGLSPRLREALRLAGLHHDDGKCDPGFQERLGNSKHDRSPLLAKSGGSAQRAGRRRGGSPWRHEQLSAAYAARELLAHEDGALIVRLVGTSHGRGRPFFPHGHQSLLKGRHQYVAAAAIDLFETGSGWSSVLRATDAQYGVWGTAFLEAILRAADCQVSAEGS